MNSEITAEARRRREKTHLLRLCASAVDHGSSPRPHSSSFLLLVDPPAGGAWNMAVDEALLEDAALQRRCWLRLYRWQEPTLSLGYFQSYADRRQHAASSGCPAVRRSSGGGAILHDLEVTYSLAVPEGHPLATSRLRTYRAVHEALVQTLAQRGIGAKIHGKADRPQAAKPPFLCFQRRSPGDVLVGGDKIAGSAQRGVAGPCSSTVACCLRGRVVPRSCPGWKKWQISRWMPKNFVREWLVSLAAALAINWEPGELSPSQRCTAATIADRKYSTVGWTKNR